MPKRYQEAYPTEPIIDSGSVACRSAADLLTLEYFEAVPARMPSERYEQHHILLNLKDEPYRVENWRNGKHRDFVLNQHEIIVTPAGMESGWHWHQRSKVIVITLEPDRLERFAQTELGVLLTGTQLEDEPVLSDADICEAGVQLKEALESRAVGSDLMFESLARVFLIKLIQRYGQTLDDDQKYGRRFTAQHYKRVLDFVGENYGRTISLEELADQTALSPSHFSRLFRQTIGSSPMQFVMSYRIERAKKALRVQGKPLADIAAQCGFSDQAHFSRTFKAAVGQSPSGYRKSIT